MLITTNVSPKTISRTSLLLYGNMKLSWKWCTPIILRLLALSQETIGASASAFSNLGSVHLVGGFYLGVAASPSNVLAGSYSQPRPHLSLDGTTFVQLSSHELSLPIMPL